MDSPGPSLPGRERSRSNSSSSRPSTSSSDEGSITSASAITRKSPYAAVPRSDRSDSDAASRLSDVSGSFPILMPPTRRRNWTCILLFAILLVVIVALSLALGLCYGLHKDHDSLPDGPVIDLGYSRYQGKYLSNGVSQFLGIRYAAPPTEDLRWRAPVEPAQTEKIQNAQQWGAYCIGIDEDEDDDSEEDCLYVNVWAPTNVTDDQKLPVSVFLQGGGYVINSNPYPNGSHLVENSGHNMVFVSFNYRVGLFGFLAGEDVKNDGVLNAGLLDQRFLLKWVQTHISKWGGDPDHVVLQGESAGAGSASLHMTAYGGRDDGLFVGVIAESTFWPGQSHYSDLEYQYQRLLNQTTCSEVDDKMTCLRSLAVGNLQRYNFNMPFKGRNGAPRFYWTPVTDGDILRDTPYNSFQRGDFVKVPVLFGTTSHEGSYFTPNVTFTDQYVIFMEDNYPLLTRNNTNEMLEHYPLEPALPNRDPIFTSACRAFGEATFICPTSTILNVLQSANSTSSSTNSSSTYAQNIFAYRYNLTDYHYVGAGLGVPHTFEMAAVFGPTMTHSAISYFTYNAPIVPIVQNYWISFIRSLNPNTYRYETAPEWLSWGDSKRRLVLQLPDSSMESVSQAERQRCQFWHSISEAMCQ